MPRTAHRAGQHRDDAAEARRRKVASLMLSGVVKRVDIAAQVGCSLPTLRRDVELIEEGWRQESARDVGTYKARAILRVQALIAALWPKAMAGDIKAVGQIVDLMAREAKIVGYDAAMRVNHEVNIQMAAHQVAEQLGLDVGDVLAEAQRILDAQVTS